MFDKDDCFRIGHIARIHGYKGELSIFLDVDHPDEFENMESVFVEYDKKLIPFFLEEIRIQHKGNALVKFEDIDSDVKAKILVGSSLYLPLDILDKEENQNKTTKDLTGFNVHDEVFGALGKITSIQEHNGNSVLEIDHNGIEILIPNQPEFIQKIDRRKKTIFIKAPEGLIGLYLNEEEE